MTSTPFYMYVLIIPSCTTWCCNSCALL